MECDVSTQFGQLAKAFDERIPWLVFLGIWPIFENLSDEPEFKSLLKKIST